MEKRLIQSVVFAMCLIGSIDGFAASATPSNRGQLTVDGKTITLTHAYAFSGPDTFDGTKEAYLVLLTEKAVPPDAIKAADSFDALGEKSVRSLLDSGIALNIGPDKGYHLTIRHPALGGKELQTSGFSDLQIATLGPNKVAGLLASSSGLGENAADGGVEEITPNHKAKFKINFDVPVSRHFPLEEKLVLGANAAKLPAGGGDPGKAWIAQECKAPPARPDFKDPKAVEKFLFAQGMTEKDLQAEIERLSKQQNRKVTRDEVIKKMAELMAGIADLGDATTPKDCTVTGGSADGKLAIIQVEATMGGGRVATDVSLVREKGAWVVKKTGAWRTP